MDKSTRQQYSKEQLPYHFSTGKVTQKISENQKFRGLGKKKKEDSRIYITQFPIRLKPG